MKWIKNNIGKFPGWIASVIWYNRLPYLAPITVMLFPALAAFR